MQFLGGWLGYPTMSIRYQLQERHHTRLHRIRTEKKMTLVLAVLLRGLSHCQMSRYCVFEINKNAGRRSCKRRLTVRHLILRRNGSNKLADHTVDHLRLSAGRLVRLLANLQADLPASIVPIQSDSMSES